MQGKFEILLLLVTLYIATARVVDAAVVTECPKNEEWDLCGELCAPTCSVQHPNPRWCPRIECSQFTAGCRCNKGFVRDTEVTGKCVLPENCNHLE